MTDAGLWLFISLQMTDAGLWQFISLVLKLNWDLENYGRRWWPDYYITTNNLQKILTRQ